MTQKLLQLTISRVDKMIFDGEVVSVAVPGADGDMELFADHEPLISPLRAGVVTVKTANAEPETHEIESGTLEISNNHATILI